MMDLDEEEFPGPPMVVLSAPMVSVATPIVVDDPMVGVGNPMIVVVAASLPAS